LIKGIQLLRAIAALAVVYLHYGFHLQNIGEFGVDIFFVISGFIIAYMVNKSTQGFLLKRLVRVSPLYFIGTLFVILLHAIKPEWFRSAIVNSEAIIKSFLYIPYTIGKSGPILVVGWTLNYEMFFYLVTAFCILIFRKKGLIVPACGFFLGLFVLILHNVSTNSDYLNFFKDGLLPEFIYGLVLYYFWEFYSKRRNKQVDLLLVIMGFGGISFMISCDVMNWFYWVSRSLVNGLPSLVFVNAFLVLEDKISSENAIIKWSLRLGDASYAMYIFHPFIIFLLLRVVYPKLLGDYTNITLEWLKLVFAMLSVCGISILIFRYVDHPINLFFKRVLKK
jgi:exopolysaccharide production protein ExoZ